MKNIDKNQVIKALGLDFDTYEYYDDGGLIMRYHKKDGVTEAFDDEDLKWKNDYPEFNIREQFNNPFADVDEYTKDQEKELVDLAVSLVEWEEDDE